jgi:predicted RNA binding protein YcfA (HicA-like mRNA interferase family)
MKQRDLVKLLKDAGWYLQGTAMSTTCLRNEDPAES